MVRQSGMQATKTKKTSKQIQLKRRLEEEILKQESSSTTSTASTEAEESAESSESFYKTQANIHDTLLQTDSESLEEDEPEYVQCMELSSELDFFKAFRNLTDIENISEDDSDASIHLEAANILSKQSTQDVEHFVKPLAGTEIEDLAELIPTKIAEYEIAKQQEDSFNTLSLTSSSASLTSAKIIDQEASLPYTSIILDDTLKTFLEMQMPDEVAKSSEIDFEPLARQEENKYLQNQTLEFLNELINKAVKSSEFQRPEKLLLQNLDKRKLFLELNDKITNMRKERCVGDFLNRRIVLHFRRKKSLRSIMADSPKNLLHYKEKLYKAKEELDQVLCKKRKLISAVEKLKLELTEQYDQLKQEAATKVQLFENKVRNYLYQSKSPKMKASVEGLLVNMNQYRQEISEIRLNLFLHQDTETRLKGLNSQMENLGNDISLKSFITLQAEIQALGKKLEERNVEVKKLHLRKNKHLHITAHYKENQQEVNNSIHIQSEMLNKLLNDKLILRQRVLSLKLQHTQNRRDMSRLSAETGLLSKPALMYDYDNTMEILKERQDLVEYLKGILLLKERKVQEILKRSSNEQKSIIYI